MDDWEEDDIDASQFLPGESGTLLPPFKLKEKIIKKPENILDELNKPVIQKYKIINK